MTLQKIIREKLIDYAEKYGLEAGKILLEIEIEAYIANDYLDIMLNSILRIF